MANNFLIDQIIIERCTTRYSARCNKCHKLPIGMRMILVYTVGKIGKYPKVRKRYYCIEHALEWLKVHNIFENNNFFDMSIFAVEYKKEKKLKKIEDNAFTFLKID